MIKINRKLILNESEIIYIDHYDRQTYIHTIANTYTTYQSTKEVIKLLPDNFIKINKALIVNKNHIKKIDKGGVYIMSNDEILYGAIRKAGYHNRLRKEMKGVIFFY